MRISKKSGAMLVAAIFMSTALGPAASFAAPATPGCSHAETNARVIESQDNGTVNIDGIEYGYDAEHAWVIRCRELSSPDGALQIQDQIEGRPVTSIQEKAFRGRGVTSAVIPPGVTEIGDYAFYGNQIQALTVPGSVRTIGVGAFRSNPMTELEIQEGTASVGDYAFAETLLVRPALPASLMQLGKDVFGNAHYQWKASYDAQSEWPFAAVSYGGSIVQWQALMSTADGLRGYYSAVPVACEDGTVAADWKPQQDTSWYSVSTTAAGPNDASYMQYRAEMTVVARQGSMSVHLEVQNPDLALEPAEGAPSASSDITISQGEQGAFSYVMTRSLAGAAICMEGTSEIAGTSQPLSVHVPGAAPAVLGPSMLRSSIVNRTVEPGEPVSVSVELLQDGWLYGELYVLGSDGSVIGSTDDVCWLNKGLDRDEYEEEWYPTAETVEIQTDASYTGQATVVYNGMAGTTYNPFTSLQPDWGQDYIYMNTIGTIGIGVPAPEEPAPGPGGSSAIAPAPGAEVQITGTGTERIISGIRAAAPGQETTVADLLAMMEVPAGDRIEVVNPSQLSVPPTAAAATGQEYRVMTAEGTMIETATLVVSGDVLGTGIMNLPQLVRAAKAVTGTDPLTGPFLRAAQFGSAGGDTVSVADLVRMARLLNGTLAAD